MGRRERKKKNLERAREAIEKKAHDAKVMAVKKEMAVEFKIICAFWSVLEIISIDALGIFKRLRGKASPLYLADVLQDVICSYNYHHMATKWHYTRLKNKYESVTCFTHLIQNKDLFFITASTNVMNHVYRTSQCKVDLDCDWIVKKEMMLTTKFVNVLCYLRDHLQKYNKIYRRIIYQGYENDDEIYKLDLLVNCFNRLAVHHVINHMNLATKIKN